MTLSDILKEIGSLSTKEQSMLKTLLLSDTSKAIKIEQLIIEERHSAGVVCPHCGCIEGVSRNGHRKDGKQRYLCTHCGKSSVANTNSIVSGTRKDLDTWKQFIRCMVNGYSVRKSAEVCGIHKNTSFIWRHKVLDALTKLSDKLQLDGIVEADETFFPISFKGNHKKSAFTMPRESRKRGKSVSIRGLSKEQVCVPCAVARSGKAYGKITNLGRVSTKDLHNIYDDRIKENATICTDKMNSYVRFANTNGLNLVQLKTGKSKKGIYNIQRINSYHSELKRFLYPFKGVSTKYLNNYLVWHNLIKRNKSSLQDKVQYILRTSISIVANVKSSELSKRPAIPLVA
jgi:transposase-like protein